MLAGIAHGDTPIEIAHSLRLRLSTVRGYISRLHQIAGVHTAAQLRNWADNGGAVLRRDPVCPCAYCAALRVLMKEG